MPDMGGGAPAGGNPDAGGTAGTGTGFHNIDQLPLGKTLQVSYGRKKGRAKPASLSGKLRAKGYPKAPAPKNIPKI